MFRFYTSVANFSCYPRFLREGETVFQHYFIFFDDYGQTVQIINGLWYEGVRGLASGCEMGEQQIPGIDTAVGDEHD